MVQEAQNEMAQARAQERDSKIEIEDLNEKIEVLQGKIKKAELEKLQAQDRIQKALQDTEKVKLEHEANVQVQGEKERELAKVNDELDLKLEELRAVRAKLAEALQQRNLVQEKLKDKQTKLQKTNDQLMKEKAVAEKKTQKYANDIKEFKMRAEKYRMQAEDNEKQVLKYKAQIERLEEENTLAKQEMMNARARDEQSTKMLVDLKASNDARMEKLKLDNKKMKNRTADYEKRSLANLREAQTIDSNASLPKDTSNMKVGLKKASSNKRVRLVSLKQDCNIRSKPSSSSSKVTIAEKGSKVYVKKYKSRWYRSYNGETKKRLGYISRSCF